MAEDSCFQNNFGFATKNTLYDDVISSIYSINPLKCMVRHSKGIAQF